MRPSPDSSARRWDGSRVHTPPRRSLRVDPEGVSRLLRCGQSASCRECGNPIEWYVRSDERRVRLHPHEMPAHRVPASCRWHVSSGVAHPAGDGSDWCRLPHAVLCPARPAPPDAPTPVVRAAARSGPAHAQTAGCRCLLAVRGPATA
ncbi:DUF6083 domain-containing protein [Streptomyces sp. SAI-119]|uniref:DUF6083 domain-containing protein n=1 Tax=Streptomyces sp. SAI-119 TaxID=2940541 RepID=UPI0032AEBD64